VVFLALVVESLWWEGHGSVWVAKALRVVPIYVIGVRGVVLRVLGERERRVPGQREFGKVVWSSPYFPAGIV
jgi:hypothetical protein